jgi:hypothetical protein
VKAENIFLTRRERTKRIEAFLKARGWTWYKLAQEMGEDYMVVSKNLKWAAGHEGVVLDPRLSLLRSLARATGTTVGFWVDRRETK